MEGWPKARAGSFSRPSILFLFLVSSFCLLHSAFPVSAALSIANAPATNITRLSATLQANVLTTNGTNPTVVIYYGLTDGVTNSTNWSYSTNLGVCATGICQAAVSNLTPAKYYYFRAYGSETTNSAWAAATTNFETIAGGSTNTPPGVWQTVMTDSNGNLITPYQFFLINSNLIIEAINYLADTNNVASVQTNLDAHTAATNPHSITPALIGAASTSELAGVQGNVNIVSNQVSAHAMNDANPHAVTAAQAGAVPTNDPVFLAAFTNSEIITTGTVWQVTLDPVTRKLSIYAVTNAITGGSTSGVSSISLTGAVSGVITFLGPGVTQTNNTFNFSGGGTPGSNGTTGEAASIGVAWASNGVPGSAVVVTNVGTSSNALFGFIIPAGWNGTNGMDGAATLYRYFSDTASNVLVFATGTGVVSSLAGTIHTFTVPAGVSVIGAVIKWDNALGTSFTVDLAEDEMNTTADNRVPAFLFAWRKDTGQRISGANSRIDDLVNFGKETVWGLSTTPTTIIYNKFSWH